MHDFLSVSKALASEARVRSLLLLTSGELCLCQLVDVLGLAPSTVSQHLKALQDAGLVVRRKQGRWHYYRLAEAETTPAARGAIDWVLGALTDDPRIQRDARRRERVLRKDLEELCACYHG